MVKSVYVPESGGMINFADDITPQEMSDYINAKYPRAAAPQTAAPASDNSSISDRIAYGLGKGIVNIPGGIASLFYPAATEEETLGGRISKAGRKYIEGNLNIDPTKPTTTSQQLAEGVGSLLGFVIPGTAVGKGASLLGAGARAATAAGVAAGAAQGAAVNAEARSETIRQQIASGMQISPEEQLAAQRGSALVGTLEAAPLGRFLKPLNVIFSKVPASKAAVVEQILQNRLSKVIASGASEGAQEAVSGVLDDLVEYGVYNPNVEIGQDILSNAGTGAFAGGLLEGVIQIAAGRKMRGVNQLREDLKTEGRQTAADLRQASVAQAAEALRKANVEGELTLDEFETPEGFASFALKRPDGNPIIEVNSQEEASQAVDLYKQMTGAKVSLFKAEKPKLDPVRVGNRRFANVEAVQKERDRLKNEVASLDRYYTNIEQVSKDAANQGITPADYAKQIDQTLNARRRELSMFDRFFTADIEATLPEAPPAPPPKKGTINLLHRDETSKGKWTEYTTEPPEIKAPPAQELEAVAPEPVVQEEVAQPEPVKPEYTEEISAEPPEPITSEVEIPEMPIGAVEMPIEESRVLPDNIVDDDYVPENNPEVAPVKTEKRPAATVDDLAALQTELFGQPTNVREMTPEQLAVYQAERDKRFPPQDTDVYYDAAPLNEPAPRNIREAIVSGPTVRDYTPETEQWIKSVYTQLGNRLKGIVPQGAELNFKTLIDAPAGYLVRGQARVENAPDGMKGIIDLATGILRPGMTVEQAVNKLVDTMNHEIVHVLKTKGVIRESEWRVLERAVENTNVPGKQYTYLDKAEAIYTPAGNPISPEYADPAVVREEAIAELYKDWVRNQTAPVQTRGLLNRITEFFRRIFQTLRNARHDDIFKKIESGEVGARKGEEAEISARFSAAPVNMEEMAGYQDEDGVHIRPFPADATTSSTAYLREQFKRFKGKGRYLDEQWGRAFDEAFIEKFGRTYDINDPADYAKIVDAISDEVRLQMKQAQSGVGWYDSDIQDVFDELAKSFPILKDPADGPAMRQMFTVIAGVMSNGMKAKANVELAAINFAHFLRTGSFSPIHPFTKTGWNQRSNIMGPQIAMLNRMINDPMFAPRQGSNNPRIERFEKFLRFMFTEHSVREINAFRAAHGTKSPAKIGKLDERRLGMYAFGPKFGPFILNLNGLSDETVDSWASRSFYRHMGRSVGPDGQLYKAPLTSNREAMKRALSDVGAQTNLSSRDIQAVLWFYEKELYNQLGQSNPLEVFSDGAKEFTRKYGTRTAGSSQPRAGREGEISRSIKAAGTRTGQSIPRGPRFSASPAVDSAEFKKWFGNSVAVDADGTPTRYYHGTPFSFSEFGKGRSGSVEGSEGPFFFSKSAKFANQYATSRLHAGGHGKDIKSGGKMIPVYLSVKNPFDYENKDHVKAVIRQLRDGYKDGKYSFGDIMAFEGEELDALANMVKSGAVNSEQDLVIDRLDTLAGKMYNGQWPELESKGVQKAIRDLGFDGFYVNESGFKNIAVFKPEQVKSIFNKFEEGAATSTRFSAAPLPPYVERQNETLFAPAPKISYRDMIFDWFFGHRNSDKRLSTMNGQVDISKSTMAGLSAKAAAVDKSAYVTHLESLLNQQETGNFQRMTADYSATAALAWRRRSGHITASMMLRGKLEINFERPGDIQSATMKVTDDPDSLKEVFKVMTEPGPERADGTPTTKADIFKSYAVARRGEWLRSTGQAVPAAITPQYIRETIEFTRREYPEVIEAYNKYQRFNKNLLTAAKDAGIISQAELGRLTNQMNYYGFIYEVYGEPLGPTSAQKTASKFKLRAYTGTEYGGLANDPMFVMIQNAQFWVDSIAKNLAAIKAYRVASMMDEARPLLSDQTPDETKGEAKDVMYYSEGGVVKKFAVKDPLLVAALGSDDRINVGKFWETLGLPAHVLRESVTRDPAFMARNLLRDTVAAWMNSGVDFVPVIDTLKGFTTALKDGTSFQALSARGVVGSYDMAMMGPQEIAATFRRNAMPLNVHTVTSVEGGSAAIRSLWNRLGSISEASDAATRIAVYDACKAKGMSDAEAAMQAIELLDFTRRGGSQTLGILTKLIPFLNARIQGMDVLYQAGRAGIRTLKGTNRGERDANIGKKFLVRGGMLAALSVALEMLNEDDEDYKQLDNYIKEGNLLIPLKEFGLEGQFLAIPKPFENGLLFSTIPQQIYKTAVGEASTRDNVNLFFSQITSTFGVNPIPQALLPPVEMITNHNFYTGLPLISEGKQRLAPELQYNTNTSQIAIMLGGLPIYYDFTTGRFGGASPIMIDKIISGYGGPLGTYLVQAVSLGMQDAQLGPERMPIELSNAPVVRSFFIDAKTKNPRVVTQAYELFRVADEANRTVSRLKQMGDAEALMDYVSKNRDILTYKKYIFGLTDRLNKLSAQERAVERDSSMTNEQKLEAQRQLREIRIRLSAQVFEINQKLGR